MQQVSKTVRRKTKMFVRWFRYSKNFLKMKCSKPERRKLKEVWKSFKEVTEKKTNLKCILENSLTNFRDLICPTSLKILSQYSHINYFLENLGASNEDQGERFHQDIKRYQGRWNINMIIDYSWMMPTEVNLNLSTTRNVAKE